MAKARLYRTPRFKLPDQPHEAALSSLTASIGAACAVLPTANTFKRARCKMRDRGTIAMTQSQVSGQDSCTTAFETQRTRLENALPTRGGICVAPGTRLAYPAFRSNQGPSCPPKTSPGKACWFQNVARFAKNWVGPSLSLTRGVLIRYGPCRKPRKSNAAQLTAVPSPLHHHPKSPCHDRLTNLHPGQCDELRT